MATMVAHRLRVGLRRWWYSKCWLVRSGVDSTWRASNYDVSCWRGVPAWMARRVAWRALRSDFPTFGHLATVARVERWHMAVPAGRVYRGWRVVFDKTEVHRAIYRCSPPRGL